MKCNIVIIGFCCLLAGCSTSTTTNNKGKAPLADIDKHNQTARLILATDSFIGHTARKCKILLNEKDVFMKSILKSWNQKNAKHVDAAKNWTIDYASDVSLEKGQGVGIMYIGEIMSDINKSGVIASDELLSMSANENVVTCHKFRSVIESGKYDLSKSNLYPQIVELAALTK